MGYVGQTMAKATLFTKRKAIEMDRKHNWTGRMKRRLLESIGIQTTTPPQQEQQSGVQQEEEEEATQDLMNMFGADDEDGDY